ncbi:hypothetical protein [Rhodanobacter sp. C03]|uniref:hypothetical protein n=1 Tax=Rhodanobacter sp. C03 TaxID=1945858 RepID=UPI0020C52223|nr:hypothetical protein [Rhodanobacter sp. C03]
MAGFVVQLRRNTESLHADIGFLHFWQLVQQRIEPGKGFFIAGLGYQQVDHSGTGAKRQNGVRSLIGKRSQRRQRGGVVARKGDLPSFEVAQMQLLLRRELRRDLIESTHELVELGAVGRLDAFSLSKQLRRIVGCRRRRSNRARYKKKQKRAAREYQPVPARLVHELVSGRRRRNGKL